MTYTYTLNDIVVFLSKANLSMSTEQLILHKLWLEGEHIPEQYRSDQRLFRRDIRREMTSFALHDDDIDELALIMRDIEPDYLLSKSNDTHDTIQFFKVIRLGLLFIADKDYYRIKLRRLLKHFGYKRRSKTLIHTLKNTLSLLSLNPYLRGYVPCDIAAIDIDAMVMIRLKK